LRQLVRAARAHERSRLVESRRGHLDGRVVAVSPRDEVVEHGIGERRPPLAARRGFGRGGLRPAAFFLERGGRNGNARGIDGGRRGAAREDERRQQWGEKSFHGRH
jgi:hypothetical protein